MDHFLVYATPILVAIAAFFWFRGRSRHAPNQTVYPFTPKPLEELFDTIDTTPDRPVNFGYKMSWLAIKSSDAQAVLDSLDIENVQPANWRTGVIAAYNHHAFVSPVVNGWVLVVTFNLSDLGSNADPDALPKLLTKLSRIHGEAQYFGTHRVSDYHAWAQFIDGKEIRAFASCDEILVNHGEQTPGETELGYEYFDPESPEAESESYWEREDLCFPDEEHVMEVAGKWSINPNLLEESGLAPGVGWIGNLVRESNSVE